MDKSIDRQVAEARGWVTDNSGIWYLDKNGVEQIGVDYYAPSTNWQQAGELLEMFRFSLWAHAHGDWCVTIKNGDSVRGATPQEAICKAVIALMENNNGYSSIR